VRIVFASDFHLDASTAGLDRFDDVSSAMRFTADEAVRLGADMYVFLGDLCDPDSPTSHRCAAELAETAFRLAREGVSFRAIAGNHDVIDDGHGTSTLSAIAGAALGLSSDDYGPDVRVYERPSSETAWPEFGVLFLWLPYVSRALHYDPEEFVATVPVLGSPRAVIACGHLTVPEAERGSESDDFARGRDVIFPAAALRERFGSRVVMVNGHYHRMQEAGGVRIPGSLVRLRFDEEHNAPGFLVLEV
jgi:DNA repair exonuclease SbcCD nuclease subunit